MAASHETQQLEKDIFAFTSFNWSIWQPFLSSEIKSRDIFFKPVNTPQRSYTEVVKHLRFISCCFFFGINHMSHEFKRVLDNQRKAFGWDITLALL